MEILGILSSRASNRYGRAIKKADIGFAHTIVPQSQVLNFAEFFFFEGERTRTGLPGELQQ